MAQIAFHSRVTAPINDCCEAAGIGRTKLYELIQSGEVESVQIGRRRLVLVRSLMALIDPKAAIPAQGAES
jgi:excisionase family DNA binding protein